MNNKQKALKIMILLIKKGSNGHELACQPVVNFHWN